MTTEMKSKTYRVPIKYLNGNAARMLFWDAVYYLLETKGETDSQGNRDVETTNDQLKELTGLSERAISEQRNRAASQDDKRYNLLSGELGWPSHGHILTLTGYEALLSKDVVEKPVSYVENGWLKNLYIKGNRSRTPLEVINCFFREPNGSSIKREDLVEGRQNSDKRKINKALSDFVELGLIEYDKTSSYRLIKKRFDTNADSAWKQRTSPIGVMYVSQPDDDRRMVHSVYPWKTLTIGRSQKNQIVIHSRYKRVSKVHARVESQLRAVRLYDANSKRKTFVEKNKGGEEGLSLQEVDSEAGVLLQDGDMIYLAGKHDGGCQIRFELPSGGIPTDGESMTAPTR